jgi:hypothetical protein
MAPAPNTRLLVACAMKSGSTFIAKVLALYFDAQRVEPVPYWGRLEQNLYEPMVAPHLDRGLVLQMHLKPHVPNLDLLRNLGFQVVWVWRNLGDVIVSFDDHIRNEDYRNPVCYVHDRDRYLAMPAERRYNYLIDHAIPWYIGFWLSWQRARTELPFVETHYETLAEDPFSYFAPAIQGLGHKLDEERLRGILSRQIPGTRFNKGVNGRSASLLSADNKRRLESMLLDHFEDLRPLCRELPWPASLSRSAPRAQLIERVRRAARGLAGKAS